MYLISYDITDNRLRLKLAKQLIRHGMYRVQYSVFMGNLRDSTYARLQKQLKKLEQEKSWSSSDSVLLLPLHAYSRDYLFVIGQLPRDWDLIEGNLHTLVL